MLCAHCRKEIDPDSTFCKFCGQKIGLSIPTEKQPNTGIKEVMNTDYFIGGFSMKWYDFLIRCLFPLWAGITAVQLLLLTVNTVTNSYGGDWSRYFPFSGIGVFHAALTFFTLLHLVVLLFIRNRLARQKKIAFSLALGEIFLFAGLLFILLPISNQWQEEHLVISLFSPILGGWLLWFATGFLYFKKRISLFH